MTNEQVNGIILIRASLKAAALPGSDAELITLVGIGDKLRAKMEPGIEPEYDELQQLAIHCSSLFEIANAEDLADFDFDDFDKKFDADFELAEDDAPKRPHKTTGVEQV